MTEQLPTSNDDVIERLLAMEGNWLEVCDWGEGDIADQIRKLPVRNLHLPRDAVKAIADFWYTKVHLASDLPEPATFERTMERRSYFYRLMMAIVVELYRVICLGRIPDELKKDLNRNVAVGQTAAVGSLTTYLEHRLGVGDMSYFITPIVVLFVYASSRVGRSAWCEATGEWLFDQDINPDEGPEAVRTGS